MTIQKPFANLVVRRDSLEAVRSLLAVTEICNRCHQSRQLASPTMFVKKLGLSVPFVALSQGRLHDQNVEISATSTNTSTISNRKS